MCFQELRYTKFQHNTQDNVKPLRVVDCVSDAPKIAKPNPNRSIPIQHHCGMHKSQHIVQDDVPNGQNKYQTLGRHSI
jgi:hypothetical protein